MTSWDETKRQLTLAERGLDFADAERLFAGMSGKGSGFKDTWIDPDDAPELTEEWFASADLYDGEQVIRRGRKAGSAAPKEAVSIRLDADVLAHFRATGPGWQSRINEALRRAAGLPS